MFNDKKREKNRSIPENVSLPAADKIKDPVTGLPILSEENLKRMRQWDRENQL